MGVVLKDGTDWAEISQLVIEVLVCAPQNLLRLLDVPPRIASPIGRAGRRRIGRGAEQRLANLDVAEEKVLLVQPRRSQLVTSSLPLLRLHAAQAGTTFSRV